MKRKFDLLFLTLCLILFVFLSVGCENEIEHKKTDGGELELSGGLIETLNDSLEKSGTITEPSTRTFQGKLEAIKRGAQALIVKFNAADYYYACAYYSSEHEYEHVDFCCHDKYTWVGFDKETDIKEFYDGKQFVAAFQINKSSLCKTIDESIEQRSTSIERYKRYIPEFKNGSNSASAFAYEDYFLFVEMYDDRLETSQMPSSEVIYYELWDGWTNLFEINCLDIDETTYLSIYSHTELSDGTTTISYFDIEFGNYYDELTNIAITDKYSEVLSDGSIKYYALFGIKDIINFCKLVER